MTHTQPMPLPESQMGPAEKLLDLVLNSSAHLWHNRPGLDVAGQWHPRRGTSRAIAAHGTAVRPGLFVPAAVSLYSQLLEIYQLNVDLMAHFASYALKETDWRDLKVASAALMLVQTRSGQPVHDDDGTVAFHDDDYRVIGEAMLLHYEKKSPRMMTPKGVLRVAELLETADIAELNRIAGLRRPGGEEAAARPLEEAATKWLAHAREEPAAARGPGAPLATRRPSRRSRARPDTSRRRSDSSRSSAGSRSRQRAVTARSASTASTLEKRERFDDVSEAEICEPSSRKSSGTRT